ncbi:Lysophospholipase, alpha-beta hydrolase superfamily [Paenibacillus catalpae]|uniref:Lysophospholipase, alpha-beta hydrolase superfamily n=1 Tax=Paenibacillus catalpae TaxID=1045775 RepID=A0A1I1XEK8_9BACL|nr:alpha/beta hydrolase [Paenibacillus catalpae]SFE05772.1 Lysophospholipase, alpha-beta hydrolase superfamily [Paenibacillus catalpae]
MKRTDWRFSGANGTDIYAREWLPDGKEPKGVICIVHGMGEHGERYSAVAERLTGEGYAVLAHDQEGHGLSAGQRGHLSSIETAVHNAGLLLEQAGTRHPQLPSFLYGHSMGGNVALNCALRLQPNIEGLILSSPWLRLAKGPNAVMKALARLLVRVMPKLSLSTGISPDDLYRPGYEHAITFLGDPLCHSSITIRTFHIMTDAGEWAIAHSKELQVPVLLLHGTGDKVTSFEASKEVAEHLGDRCKFVAYEGGYHELHNDIFAVHLLNIVTNWITRRL